MGETLTFAAAPDLRLLYAKALANGGIGRRVAGRPLPEVTARQPSVLVDRDRLLDYQRLCGFGASATLPVSYPHLLAFRLQVAIMSRRDFPLRLLGLVHVENSVTWTRPLTLDDVLDLTVHATGLRGHRRGRLVDLVAEVTCAGAVVWRGVSTYLHRDQGDPAAPAPSAPAPSAPAPLAPAPSAPAPSAPDVEHLTGRPGGVTLRFEAGSGRRYAAVSGDLNPIHLHPLTARALGFPSTIAHGMYAYARVLAALGPRLPAAGASAVWFRRPVPLPSSAVLKVSDDARLAALVPSVGQGAHLVVENRGT